MRTVTAKPEAAAATRSSPGKAVRPGIAPVNTIIKEVESSPGDSIAVQPHDLHPSVPLVLRLRGPPLMRGQHGPVQERDLRMRLARADLSRAFLAGLALSTLTPIGFGQTVRKKVNTKTSRRARLYHAMPYDSARQRTVRSGKSGGTVPFYEFDGKTWRRDTTLFAGRAHLRTRTGRSHCGRRFQSTPRSVVSGSKPGASSATLRGPAFVAWSSPTGCGS